MNSFLHSSHGVVLAEIGSAESATSFFSQGLGLYIQRAFIAIGILLVVLTIVNALKSFSKGDTPGVVKTILGGLFAAVICFNLPLVFGLIPALGKAFQAIMDTFSGFFG